MRQLNSVGLRSVQHNISVMTQTTVSISAGLATSKKPSTASLRLCIACSNRFPLASDIEFGTKSHVAAGFFGIQDCIGHPAQYVAEIGLRDATQRKSGSSRSLMTSSL